MAKSLQHYKHLKYLGDEMVNRSKYNNNILLQLVTPFTYEKRLNSLIVKSAKHKKWNSNNNILYKTATRFQTDNYNINNIDNNYINPIEKKIIIK